MKYLILALALLCPSAQAEYMTTGKLRAWMVSGESIERAAAYGYVMGIFDAEMSLSHCAVGEPPLGPLLAAVLKAASTVNADATADRFLRALFTLIFPCKQADPAEPMPGRGA